jgi:LmbE family N-acetylglucosaminyl deacetylase
MTEPSKQPLRILGIFAHPDDSEFMLGGTAARWTDEGAHVTYCIVTNGAAGSNDPKQDLAEMVKLLEAEQRTACAVLGIR